MGSQTASLQHLRFFFFTTKYNFFDTKCFSLPVFLAVFFGCGFFHCNLCQKSAKPKDNEQFSEFIKFLFITFFCHFLDFFGLQFNCVTLLLSSSIEWITFAKMWWESFYTPGTFVMYCMMLRCSTPS